MTKLKDGDNFIINKCKHNKAVQAHYDSDKSEFTIGKIYEVGVTCGDLVFTDNEGNDRPVDNWIEANGMDKEDRFQITKIKA